VTASFADNEIWHVLMDGNDMKRLNVEQLDDAFRLSLVDASTMVWKAGMNTWQRLGAVAGMDDDEREESITRHIKAPPPPPRPMARPTPRPPSRAPAAFHTAAVPVYQMDTLLAPVFTPTLHAPDPYVLPKRRVAVPSEVDFRRGSGGVRWGRWLLALLLIGRRARRVSPKPAASGRAKARRRNQIFGERASCRRVRKRQGAVRRQAGAHAPGALAWTERGA